MQNLNFRPQQVADAQRFMDILNNPNFIYFPVKVKSLSWEIAYLETLESKRAAGFCYDFTILDGDYPIGAVGLKVDQHRKFIGEIGYFVDYDHWGKGVALAAVAWIEQWARENLPISRFTILVQPENVGSVRVAQKAGYELEGIMKNAIPGVEKPLVDACLFAKTY